MGIYNNCTIENSRFRINPLDPELPDVMDGETDKSISRGQRVKGVTDK